MTRARSAFVALAVIASTFVPAAAVGNVVQIRSNFFDPRELYVPVGATVTWTAVESGHSVTADDGRFDWPPVGTANRGDSFDYTFGGDETVSYHCRVHPGMAGIVVVGEGSPEEPPPPPPVTEERAVPSEEYPTINSALAGAPYGTVITVAPGIYFGAIAIERPGITLQGGGAAPGDTILDGTGFYGTGLLITARDVAVRNVTVRQWVQNGIWALGARAVILEDVVSRQALGSHPIRLTNSSGRLSRVRVTDGRQAGIFVESCATCDLIVEDSVLERNFIGLSAVDAGALVVRRSQFTQNDTGILLRTHTGDAAPQKGSHIVGNTFTGHGFDRAPLPFPPSTDRPEVPSGAGVWIAGGWLNVVENNVFATQRVGVLVAGAVPGYGNRIVNNTITGPLGLAWNGLGARTCFSGNKTPLGADTPTDPPALQTVSSCSLGAPVGVPYPKVDADLARYAADRWTKSLL